MRIIDSAGMGTRFPVSRFAIALIAITGFAALSFILPQSTPQYLWCIEPEDAVADTTLPDVARSAVDDDDGAPLKSVSVDLNGDGIKEKLLPNESLRGSGGCPWVVFDGKGKRVIGKLNALVIFAQTRRESGYLVLECYWKNGGGSGSVVIYSFNGKSYRKTGGYSLQDEEIDKYFNDRKNVPHPKVKK